MRQPPRLPLLDLVLMGLTALVLLATTVLMSHLL
jgi:hypothetical protein